MLHSYVVEGQYEGTRGPDQVSHAGLEGLPQPCQRITGTSPFGKHVNPLAGGESLGEKVHAGLIDPPATDDGDGFSSVEDGSLERCVEKVDGIRCDPPKAAPGRRDEAGGDEWVIEQADMVAERQQASVVSQRRVESLETDHIDAVAEGHHGSRYTCDGFGRPVPEKAGCGVETLDGNVCAGVEGRARQGFVHGVTLGEYKQRTECILFVLAGLRGMCRSLGWSSGMTAVETAPRLALVFGVAATTVGVAFLAAGPDGALLGALAVGIQWMAFLPAWWQRSERFYDLTGSLTYVLVMWFGLVLAPVASDRAWLLAGLVSVWTWRLGSFLVVRIARDGRDGRFDALKQQFDRFLVAWTLQGMWVVMTALAVIVVLLDPTPVPLAAGDLFGFSVWGLGFLLEVVADRQKSAFRERGETGWIDEGLWAWSRHPNYLGEIVLWTGILLVAIPVLQGGQWLALLSPLFVTLLLTKVSGIPLLEARADAKWGGNPAYEDYKGRVPVLVPSLSKVLTASMLRRRSS